MMRLAQRSKAARARWPQLLAFAGTAFVLVYILWAMKLLKQPSPSLHSQPQEVLHIVKDERSSSSSPASDQIRGQKLAEGGDSGTKPLTGLAAASPAVQQQSPLPSPNPPSPSPPQLHSPPPPSPALSASPAETVQQASKEDEATVVTPAGTKVTPAETKVTPTEGGPVIGRNSGSQASFLLPTGGGTLFSWGLAEARLGRTDGDTSIPEPAMDNLQVVSIAASRHSAIATAEGHVWTMGHNDSKGGGGHGSPPLEASGQLGRRGSRKPGRVTLNLEGEVVIQVITGRYHTLAVTAGGSVFTWGLNDWGQLGRAGVGAGSEADVTKCYGGPTCHDGAPRRVEQLEGIKVVGAASGRYNSMVLDERGRLYVWGYDGCASNGTLPAQEAAWELRGVGGQLQGKKVVAFDAGYTLWIAATEDGGVYTCNHQDDGYAGTLERKRKPNEGGELGRIGDPLVPMKVLGELADKKVTAVAAGREHALAVTSDGAVYSWGGRGEVSGRKGTDLTQPGLVKGALVGDKVVFVAAGEYFSLAASRRYVYGWGGNDYLCVGVGRNNTSSGQIIKPGRDRGLVPVPARVSGPLSDGSWRVLGIAAGFQHSLAIAVKAGAEDSEAEAAGGGTEEGGAAVEEEAAQAGEEGVEVEAEDGELGAAVGEEGGVGAEGDEAAAAEGEERGDAGEGEGGVEEEDWGVGGAAKAGEGGGEKTDEQEAAAATAAEEGSEAAAAAASSPPADSAAASSPAAAAAPVNLTYHSHYALAQAVPASVSVADVWSHFEPSANHKDIVAASPDVFAGLPEFFSSRFKNPCWFQNGTLRCIPYYHIIGVSKCGTTDIYNRLVKHPHVYESRNKGPHWWDECPWPLKGKCTAPPKGDFDGYIDLFADAAKRILKDPVGITGEASSNTYTAANGVYLRGPTMTRTDLKVTMPALLYEASPFLRLILIFRDPIERYYSAFYYYRWWKKDEPTPGPEDFHKTAVQEVNEWNACVGAKGQATCVRLYHPQQLVKGMYSEFLGDWLRHFPREQLLVLRNEDYKVAQREHMQAVFGFLGMRELSEKEWGVVMGMPIKNVGKQRGQMLPETRQLLEEFYRPFNQKLAQMLGDERYLWGAPPAAAAAAAAAV